MNIFEDIVKSGLFERIIWAILVIILSCTIYAITSKFFKAKEKKNSKILSSKKNKTYLRMFRNIIGAVLGVVTFLTILQIFGVNVSSMLAGVGIASIVIGFALQDALKDIIRGFEIISDGYYDIGDYVKYGDTVGEVLSIGLRTTKIQDMNSMNIVSIANRNIDQVEVVSEYIYITVPLPFEIKPDAADLLMTEIAKEVKKQKDVESCEYQGLNSIAESTLNYQIALTCDPANKLTVNREALQVIVRVLAAHKLRLPYNHLVVHGK
ncbi:mechanosensitive ion channel family protein [Candidatus Saccharibacteria bacterium]|nr:mechanosensitive ion channel family protein [Candidatus Saccharibacteria bacterium]